jgi:hypothetical protein
MTKISFGSYGSLYMAEDTKRPNQQVAVKFETGEALN